VTNLIIHRDFFAAVKLPSRFASSSSTVVNTTAVVDFGAWSRGQICPTIRTFLAFLAVVASQEEPVRQHRNFNDIHTGPNSNSSAFYRRIRIKSANAEKIEPEEFTAAQLPESRRLRKLQAISALMALLLS
jgi:hypothetical protein